LYKLLHTFFEFDSLANQAGLEMNLSANAKMQPAKVVQTIGPEAFWATALIRHTLILTTA
jgi:hypothetical protein